MRHRFYLEDDLIKVGWGGESSLDEWDTILAWVIRALDESSVPLHVMLDFSDIYHISEEVFHPEIAARLANHPQAGAFLLISNNPIFVHFVNAHWVAEAEEPIGLRAFLDSTDALTWLRGET